MSAPFCCIRYVACNLGIWANTPIGNHKIEPQAEGPLTYCNIYQYSGTLRSFLRWPKALRLYESQQFLIRNILSWCNPSHFHHSNHVMRTNYLPVRCAVPPPSRKEALTHSLSSHAFSEATRTILPLRIPTGDEGGARR